MRAFGFKRASSPKIGDNADEGQDMGSSARAKKPEGKRDKRGKHSSEYEALKSEYDAKVERLAELESQFNSECNRAERFEEENAKMNSTLIKYNDAVLDFLNDNHIGPDRRSGMARLHQVLGFGREVVQHRNNANEEISSLRRKIGNYVNTDQQIADLRRQHSNNTQTLQKEHAKQIQAMEERISTLQANVRAAQAEEALAKAELKLIRSTELREAEEKRRAAEDKARRTDEIVVEEREKVRTDYRQILDNAQRTHDAEKTRLQGLINRLTAEKQAQEESLKREKDAELFNLRVLKEKEYDKLKEWADKRYNELRAWADGELKKLEDEVSSLTAEHEKALGERDDDYAKLESRRQKEIAEREQSYADLVKQHQEELASIQAGIEDAIQEATKEANEKVQETELQMGRAAEEHINEIAKLKKEKREALEEQEAATEKDYLRQQKWYEEKLAAKDKHNNWLMAQHAEEMDKKKKEHADEMEKKREEHKTQLQQKEVEHARETEGLRKQAESLKETIAANDQKQARMFANYQAQAQREYEVDMLKLVDFHEADTRELNERVKELENALFTQTDDSRAATDQALKRKFTDLRELIKKTTLPHNLQLPASTLLPAELDPGRFLERHGRGEKQLQFVLRGLFWEVLVDGFFSLPFGFGFLGRTGGRAELDKIYLPWLKLYYGEDAVLDKAAVAAASASLDELEAGGALSIFNEDPEANKWRSAFFQSFCSIIMPKGITGGVAPASAAAGPGTPGSSSGQPQQGATAQPPQSLALPATPASSASASASTRAIALLYESNCAAVQERLLSILTEATAGALPRDVRAEIPTIARLAGELALEFGRQRALVHLLRRSAGDRVRIGAEFVDCQDGGSAKGREFTVDLLVSPGLCKVGDGRGDLRARRVLVPGEIYPTRY